MKAKYVNYIGKIRKLKNAESNSCLSPKISSVKIQIKRYWK